MSEIDREAMTKTIVQSALIASAVVAYFVSPLLPFANPRTLFNGGAMLGVGLGGAWSAMHGKWGKLWFGAYGLLALAGATILMVELTAAAVHSAANDRRCEQVQADMIGPKPQRPDGPDLFQALRCRPQGRSPIALPPRAAHEPR